MTTERVIVVTGFEPFGTHRTNPSEELAKAVDGRRFGDATTHSVILPVHHQDACARFAPMLAEIDPAAVVHLGLAEGRARVALERVAVNVMDYSRPDNAGYRAADEPCIAGGPVAYFATLPLRAMLDALVADGVPAYISNTAGTYLCNQTLYATRHLVETEGRRARVGFVHLPLLPSQVAASGLEQPSMDFALMLRAIETVLRVVVEDTPAERSANG